MLYCVNRVKKETAAGQRTAGKKAPDDILRISVEHFQAVEIPFYETQIPLNAPTRRFGEFHENRRNMMRLVDTVAPGDVVIIQHPYEGIKQCAPYLERCKDKGVTIVVLIHDLRQMRLGIDMKQTGFFNWFDKNAEYQILTLADYIICHNETMKAFIGKMGIRTDKMFCLDIFDYLHDQNVTTYRRRDKRICIAGNLSVDKSQYLSHLNEIDCGFELFGPNYPETLSGGNITYHGTIAPDVLPSKLEGSFGLVWDGDAIDTCSGVPGEYLRINNPHKCSLYIASNLPVIVWKDSAMAGFVLENHLGIAVDSLREIPAAIDTLSDESYAEMLHQVVATSEKLKNGHYFGTQLSRVLELAQSHS